MAAKCPRRMYFYGPRTHLRVGGLNNTIRNGDKWLDAEGRIVELWACDGEVESRIGTARIVVTKLINYANTDQMKSFLYRNHDPYCRTFAGLDRQMKRAYPDGVDPQCTVVFFEVTETCLQLTTAPKKKKK